MNTLTPIFRTAAFFVCLTAISPLAFATFKCKTADGKIEYSDRPCDTDKAYLGQPRTTPGVQKLERSGMDALNKLFGDYEGRLCEREKLANEIDLASRSGQLRSKNDAYKAKQDRLSELNEVLVDFQTRASRVTKAAGPESDETLALRKFQLGLKDCGKEEKGEKGEKAEKGDKNDKGDKKPRDAKSEPAPTPAKPPAK